VECTSDPDVAVTVTADVTGDEPPPPPPLPPLLPPPPQDDIRPMAAQAINIVQTDWFNRFLRQNTMHPASESTAIGRPGRERGRASAVALAAMVSWFVTLLGVEGVTVAGLNVHVTPAGSPEHKKVTVPLNRFCGVTVRVSEPCPPGLKVNEPGCAAN